MNARIEVQRHAANTAPWSTAVGAEQSQDETAATKGPTGAVPAMARQNPWTAEAEPARFSIDPMRATDRYRLVVPYALR